MMPYTMAEIILIGKYIAATLILLVIIFTPAWLARQTQKDKVAMGRVRVASWLTGWTGIGWFLSLFWASRA